MKISNEELLAEIKRRIKDGTLKIVMPEVDIGDEPELHDAYIDFDDEKDAIVLDLRY